ncbi:MAG TPA: 1-deoxy-D-xylulose-5-phosphate reductoisomerase [Dehalococcoidia bacterium]|nr:1-deoxy-D-xylulose-5-phosphate reductoisomerase [Dehalococcoidia bacterium]
MAVVVKRLAILGSTGSIGRQTLDVVRAIPDLFQVVGLAAGGNIGLLKEQVKEFKPRYVNYLTDAKKPDDIPSCEFLSLEDIASHRDVDTVVIATPGTQGLHATLAAARRGKSIALANKESLVAAGEILIEEVKKGGARILPVDSEHSAIWQCLQGENQPARRIILTASGGPFRHYTRARLEKVTVEQALAHPSWKMGRKVTIDSATLMNKGLEIIEAHWLFGVSVEDISVVIHPQSIIHSMVEFADGSIKAQLSYPDMRLPIQYALTFPNRLANTRLPALNFKKLQSLTFEPPDTKKFPCLRLAVEAIKAGGTCPAALCAADEAAVELFLAERIKFMDIPSLIEKTLEQHRNIKHPDINTIVSAGIKSREKFFELSGGSSEC